MAAVYNDGNLPYGSRVLQLSSSAAVGYGAYVAEDITLNRPTAAMQRRNELNEPNGAVYTPDWVNGSATLQLANTGSQIPTTGDTFADTFSGSVETFVLSAVDQPETQGDLKKVSITFQKIYN